ncbi:DUF4907 domain-containing protein [Maribacter polysaccharolyticus]|uniref:DUF4907 domain-containing protein n=1 Tax=Maribacter polysaccharolyticus TaxID=3020831 RepID=UPI00237F3C05|nr:DUF4907 domain-containing protein [Maribacter polysaccharolyticus]MDE3741998.1 DUF4907 domain-containing protein [Maribacter polysaccharolyticus]
MKTTLKNKLAFIGIIVCLLSGVLFFGSCTDQKKGIRSEVYPVEEGFGYRILNHANKVLIQQGNIPAIQGNHPFTTAEDAEKTAEMVISKILNGEDPRLSLSDLEHLEIDIPVVKKSIE